MDELAPMMVAMTLILTVGGVILLKPLMRRLGDVLEQLAAEKRRNLNPGARPAVQGETADRLADVLERMDDRLGRLEERVNFTEAMLLSRGSAEPERSLAEKEP